MDNNANLDIVGTIILHNPGISYTEVFDMAEPYLCEFIEEEEIRDYVENKMAACCKIGSIKAMQENQ